MTDEKVVVKPPQPKREKIAVKALWPAPINGKMLLRKDKTYKLLDAAQWPVKVKFEIWEDEFNALRAPEKLVEDIELNENLWRAGVTKKGIVPELGRIQQAIHLTKYSVEQVINLLKG